MSSGDNGNGEKPKFESYGDSIPEDFSPDDFVSVLQDAVASTGAAKHCIRAKRCVRNITCEYAQVRNKTTEVQDLFEGKSSDLGDCSNWRPRLELGPTLDAPRRKRGQQRHNAHADRVSAISELIRKIDAGEPLPDSPYTPEELRNMLNQARARAAAKRAN